MSKALMKLHKRERSTSTYLQVLGSFTQTALETGIKDQTRIDLDDHLMSFNTRRASQTGIHQEATQRAVLLFQYLGMKTPSRSANEQRLGF